ncbi:nucleotidase [Saccharomycopsis crataegensis]|uniref:Nucleotidase n=1 Tax=Saccharomycopsis crataegensis TaxID=43959 RepID=A0AAV5QDK5_9ASCO|nr:nucleotidase [Saccharomycopsis crataegensis]
MSTADTTNSSASYSETNLSTPAANIAIESHLHHPGSTIKLPYQFGPVPLDDEKVFFFDIDNCLYHASYRIHDLMQVYIRKYIRKHLGVNEAEAKEINVKYYKEYGLAIQGLVYFHKIDAMKYNTEVDDSLPLHEILKPDPELRKMLIKLREANHLKRFWLFTNAYKNHGLRVIKLLGIGDLFDGMTFCDYEKQEKFICKPDSRIFEKAMRDAGVSDAKNAYFVDDSYKNCQTAIDLGFNKVVNVVENGDATNTPEGCLSISTIHDLPKVLPELFEAN